MVQFGLGAGLPSRWRRRGVWIVAALVAFVALWGQRPLPAGAAGEGVFTLDKPAYSVLEGEAVTVGVNRASGGTLTQDITVTLQLSGGTVDQDYPASTVTQQLVFKANTNPTSMQLQFQTLNQQRTYDSNVRVTIISVSGGAIGFPAQSPIKILGRNTPRVADVSPKSANKDDTVTVTGQNFALPSANCPVPPTPPTSPAGRCIYRVEFVPVGGPDVPNTGNAYDPNPIVLGTTTLQVKVPNIPSAAYDIRVVIVDPTALQPPNVNTDPGTAYPVDWAVRSPTSSTDQLMIGMTGGGGPTITSVSPNSGPITGGTLITVRGTNLSGVCSGQIYFTDGFNIVPNTSPATASMIASCVSYGPTQFTIRTPDATGFTPPISKVNVVVVIGSNTSPRTNDNVFTYFGSPTITSISPTSGPAAGGTLVTIVGTGFLGVSCPTWSPSSPLTKPSSSGVMFGPEPALGCSVTSDTQITAIAPPLAPPGAAVQQLTVHHNQTGASAFTSAANFTYISGPAVTGISPAFGPPAGGTVVTVNGSGFGPGATVSFGATAAQFVQFINSTQLQVTSPAGTGMQHITVTVQGVTSPPTPADMFSYSVPAVTAIVPNAGAPAGGTEVTITGTNFTSAATVHFGAVTVTPVFVSPIELKATTPAVTLPQVVDVRVTTGSGQSEVTADSKFTYTNGPIVAAINPPNAAMTGGVPVVITGTNFIAGATVTFGGVASEAVNVNSQTQITALVPPAAKPGTVDIQITTSVSTSPVSKLSKFKYDPAPPVITSITPNTGSTAGNTEITITGQGFSGVECPGGVKFGTSLPVQCKVNSDTSLTVVSPPGVAGQTVITVTSPGGTSEIVQNYTYVSPGSQPPPGPPGGIPAGGGVAVNPLPPPTHEAITYQLDFRWTLVVWRGADGVPIGTALQSAGQPDLTGKVSAVYGWDSGNSVWRAYFAGADAVPGATDLFVFLRGGVYWVALSSSPGIIWSSTDG